MTAQKVVSLCELAMCDSEFREAFLKNPYEAVQKWNLEILPQEITAVLSIVVDDGKKPKEVSKEFIDTKACLDGRGCDTKKTQPAGPR